MRLNKKVLERNINIFLARKYGKIPYEEIARKYNISPDRAKTICARIHVEINKTDRAMVLENEEFNSVWKEKEFLMYLLQLDEGIQCF